MARCPHAEWKPLGNDPQHQPVMAKHDLVIIHTMVGTLAGTDQMFRDQGYVGVESHFGTGYINGKLTAYQWGDTARTADANLDANPRAISIENADTSDPYRHWTGSDVPPFTDEQCELIAQITAWACQVHDIPAVLVPDSLPSRRGIGWHRQGIDPWRVAGGEKWSDSTGKVCPGDRRIAQIKAVIIPRVQAILHGQQGGGSQGGGSDDPWGTIALTKGIVTDHTGGAKIAAQLEQLIKDHPNSPEWQKIATRWRHNLVDRAGIFHDAYDLSHPKG